MKFYRANDVKLTSTRIINCDGRNPSLLAVGAIVIRGNGQKSDKFTITIGRCSSCLGNTQRIDSINSGWWLETNDFFPLQAAVAIDLVPGHLPKFVECFYGCVPFCLLQCQKILLKNGVVKVNPLPVAEYHKILRNFSVVCLIASYNYQPYNKTMLTFKLNGAARTC